MMFAFLGIAVAQESQHAEHSGGRQGGPRARLCAPLSASESGRKSP